MTIIDEFRATVDDEQPDKWAPVDAVHLTYRGTGKSKSRATFKKYDVIVVHQSTEIEESF